MFSLCFDKISKFPVFSLTGIFVGHFPCFPCAVGTLYEEEREAGLALMGHTFYGFIEYLGKSYLIRTLVNFRHRNSQIPHQNSFCGTATYLKHTKNNHFRGQLSLARTY